ncbi:MAG: hypothetical protein LBB72_05660 [Spirochaetaceae bacterium]|jgi:hypothetical protein|nr:hypothetical protein [Spirochaetaceae bacterium]
MKKTVFSLILLLGTAIVVFFLGWAQYGLSPGSVGVLRSKTHGVDGEAIQEGKLRWVWYKLIPNNAALSVFFLNDVELPIDVSGMLPSGDVFTSFVGLKSDFTFAFSGSLTYRLKAESLPALVEKENLLNQEDLDNYLALLNDKIQTHVQGLLWVYGENDKIMKEAQETGTIRALEAEFRNAFSQAELRDCTVKTLHFPDHILYDEIRKLYRDYLAAQRGEVRNDIASLAAENIKNRRRLDELAAYGELLTKYPVLLQYLAMEKGNE